MSKKNKDSVKYTEWKPQKSHKSIVPDTILPKPKYTEWKPQKSHKSLVSDTIITNFNKIDNSQEIKKMLIESKSVISGGSLLSLYNNEPFNDIDLYVNVNNLSIVLHHLSKMMYSPLNKCQYISSSYCKSFFKENGIIGRFPFTNGKYSIDVIVISEVKNIISVVSNFDLTFCEIWYDGKNIEATDFEGIVNKVGTIKESYKRKLIHDLNYYTYIRIMKYTEKGYDIKNLDIDAITEKFHDEFDEANKPVDDTIHYSIINEHSHVFYDKGEQVPIEEYAVLLLFRTLIIQYSANFIHYFYNTDILKKYIKQICGGKFDNAFISISLFTIFYENGFDHSFKSFNRILTDVFNNSSLILIDIYKTILNKSPIHKISDSSNKLYYKNPLTLSILSEINKNNNFALIPEDFEYNDLDYDVDDVVVVDDVVDDSEVTLTLSSLVLSLILSSFELSAELLLFQIRLKSDIIIFSISCICLEILSLSLLFLLSIFG